MEFKVLIEKCVNDIILKRHCGSDVAIPLIKISPLPLGEGRILNELASCKNSGEGVAHVAPLSRPSDTLSLGEGKKCAAFTLAETLITLGIIGVVAVLTIPTLIEHYQKQVTAESLKKMYSTLLQSASMYQVKNGITYDEFDTSLSAPDFLHEYFTPNMNVIKECDSVLKCYKDYPLAIDRKTKLTPEYLSVLSDGSYFGVIYSAAAGKILYFDINGAKGPNYSGRDIFYFSLINASTMSEYKGCEGHMKTLKSGLYSGGLAMCFLPFSTYSRNELLGTTIHRGCNRNASFVSALGGDACTAVIMLDGWKIKKDYPW